MEAEIKKLFQKFADSTEEQKAERSRSMEMQNLKIDAIQNA